jgi:hypothetical protein
MASSLAQRRVADRRDPDGRDRVAWLRRQRLVETRRSHAGDNLHHRAVGKNEDRFRHRQPLDLRQRQCPSHGRGDPGRGAAHDRSFLHVGPIALGSQCDPSYTLKAGTEGETGFITSLANAGDTVLMADYEGEDAAYGVGQLSGYQTLDAVRAAETWLGVPEASTPVGMLGYSGGAVATEFASELAPTYAPHLDIVGVAEGGIPVDLFHDLTTSTTPTQFGRGRSPPTWTASPEASTYAICTGSTRPKASRSPPPIRPSVRAPSPA